MFERQLYEVPRFLTTGEVAAFANITERAVKYRGTRRGWAYGIGRDGVRYWDVSTLTLEMPEVLFGGFLRHDAATLSLRDKVRSEVFQFKDTISHIRINADHMPYYLDAALLCRALEILQDAVTFMPKLSMTYACIALYFHTGIPAELLEAIGSGKEFAAPLFTLPRTFWMPLLTERVRYMDLYGAKRVEAVEMRSQKPKAKKLLRQLKPAVAAMQ